MPESSIFLDVQGLSKSYPAGKSLGWRRPMRRVLKNISFSVKRGEILGLLGESGSGKSTLARCLLGLEEPDGGEMLFEGQKPALWRKRYRGAASVVFQDYLTSVNPGFRVSEIIAEGYLAGGGKPKDQAESVALLMQRVNLPLHLARHLPHQLSGGQLQRVCIARALASKPSFMVFDEALSALDVSIQSQILD
ncbi:MAG: ABC transporter ATP-binding protein, partial [Desulfovibrio sp.]|nr:ABC transporter ATP-binding protein [Desulfovibrio sp.]